MCTVASEEDVWISAKRSGFHGNANIDSIHGRSVCQEIGEFQLGSSIWKNRKVDATCFDLRVYSHAGYLVCADRRGF
jgi:hypothetical protein